MRKIFLSAFAESGKSKKAEGGTPKTPKTPKKTLRERARDSLSGFVNRVRAK